MNMNRIEGNWKQLKGHLKQQWGFLIDDPLEVTAGWHDRLAGKIQEAYGVSKDDENRQLAAWQSQHQKIDSAL